MGILLVVCTILNWIGYHKIFKVYYLGNKSKSITNEIIWSMLGACFEVAIIMWIGEWLISVVVIIAFAIGIFLAIKEVYKLIKQAKDVFTKKDAIQSEAENVECQKEENKEDTECKKEENTEVDE